jgi:hypothetical protein
VPIPTTEKLATAPKEGGQKHVNHNTQVYFNTFYCDIVLDRENTRYRYSEEPGAHLASPESQWAA